MKQRSSPVKSFFTLIFLGLMGVAGYYGYEFYQQFVVQNEVLKKMIVRLEADSRIAEVIVTDTGFNSLTQKHTTTIKFLEYDSQGRPLEPRYFTFDNNIIQFQSLVVRFEDVHIKNADPLKGKSVYLFWKAFVLDGANTQEYDIAHVNDVPAGYKIEGPRNPFEEEIWKEFWDVALNSAKAKIKGIKNAQIEAPGTKFVPGILYTLKIEHDGGIRIDTQPIPSILKGERL